MAAIQIRITLIINHMKRTIYLSALTGLALLAAACGSKEARIDMTLSDKYEGKDIQLASYTDSTVVAEGTLTDGQLSLIVPESAEGMLLQVMIDGRARFFYVAEPGRATLTDSTSVAVGTPLNDRFAALMKQLDEIEDTDDNDAYAAYAAKEYDNNKDNPLGVYFGTEWIRFSPTARIDSILQTAPEALKNSPKTSRYRAAAVLRDATAPGQKFTDFSSEQPDGKMASLGSMLKPDGYTIVDFWASWCPYCIKEIPELKEIYAEYSDRGLEIVGVAVRDKVEDTQASMEKHQIPWKVMYNAQRIPYDIYGFTGIPHLMLIGPDGTIISRGEMPARLRERLAELLPAKVE